MMICIHLKLHCCAERIFCHYNRNRPQVSYVTCVKEILPQGPYCLVGYSFGTCVAVEMALQLEKTNCCGRSSLYSSSLIDQLTQLTTGAISEAKPTLSKVDDAFYGSTAYE